MTDRGAVVVTGVTGVAGVNGVNGERSDPFAPPASTGFPTRAAEG